MTFVSGERRKELCPDKVVIVVRCICKTRKSRNFHTRPKVCCFLSGTWASNFSACLFLDTKTLKTTSEKCSETDDGIYAELNIIHGI